MVRVACGVWSRERSSHMATELRRTGAQTQTHSSLSSSHTRAAPVTTTWKQLLPDASNRPGGGVTTRAAAAASQQQQQQQQPPLPQVRSGHAVTLLRPTESVLLFGGSDGKVFLNDFFVLEPSHYAALSTTQDSHASEISLGVSAVGEIAGLSQSSAASCDDEEIALMQSQRAPSESSQPADSTCVFHNRMLYVYNTHL